MHPTACTGFSFSALSRYFLPVLLASSCLNSTALAQVTSTWNGTAGNWSDFTRWDTNPLFPNNGNGGNNYNAIIGGGVVTVDQAIAVAGFTFSGGASLIRVSDLTVNANAALTFGTITGAGILQFNGGGSLIAQLTVSSGTLRFGDGVNASTFIQSDNGVLLLNLSAQAQVQNAAIYEINASGSNTNFGTTSAVPGTFTVEAGGTLRKIGNATHLIANSVGFINNGTIEVNQGHLRFEATLNTITNAGSIDIAAGATVEKGSGGLNLNAGSTITGAGTLIQTAGTLLANADNSISRLQMDGGSFNRLPGTTTRITSDLAWNAGSLTGSGTLQIDSGGTLNTNLQVNGGSLIFGDGVTAGTLNHTNNGRLVLNNGAEARVQNAAVYEITVTAAGSNIGSASGTPGVFIIDSGGTLRKAGNATHEIANSVALHNHGSMEVTEGILDFTFGGLFATNSGTVSIASGSSVRKSTGTLNLETGSQFLGAGDLNQTAGNLSANAANSISRLLMNGGIFSRGSGTTTNITANLTWNSGTLTGAGTLQIDSGGTLSTNLQVSGGTLIFGDGATAGTLNHTNTGRLVLNNAAEARVRNAAIYEINVTSAGSNFGRASGVPGSFSIEAGATLRKLGSATHLVTNAVTLNNAGTIELNQGNLSFELGSVLTNSGTIRVNAGILDFSIGGSLATNQGTISIASGATLRSSITNSSTGILNGAGIVTGSTFLQPGGIIGAGTSDTLTTLTAQADLWMDAGSQYAIKLFGTGPTAISLLSVTGNANITTGAELRLDLSTLTELDVAALRAAIGEGNTRTYTVLTTGGAILVGEFNAANFAISDYGAFPPDEWVFDVQTTADTVTVSFTTAVPEPGSLLLLAALGLAGHRLRNRHTTSYGGS